jgi:hypothetical protein
VKQNKAYCGGENPHQDEFISALWRFEPFGRHCNLTSENMENKKLCRHLWSVADTV